MKQKKILITGGSGFIGTNLVGFYQSNGYIVLNIDVEPPKNEKLRPFWIQCDVLNYEKTEKIIFDFQPDYILHMAARTDLEGKNVNDYLINTEGISNIISISNKITGLDKVIFASSMLVCKAGYIPKHDSDYCPPNFYGKSKVKGEEIVKAAMKNFKWTIVRPSSIWGPGFGTPYRSFFELLIKRRYFHFSGKMSTKTYGYIGNVVYQINQLLLSEESDKKTFYLGDYEPTNVKEWSSEIANELGYKIFTVPKAFVVPLAKIGDVLKCIGIAFPITSFRYRNMTTDNVVPVEATKKIAPDVIYTRKEGNIETLKWLKNIRR